MFWVPLMYAMSAVVVGLALPRLERRFFPDLTVGIDPGAALAILTAIASGMMGLTAIVFSIAFVMVQFSATAYSPRLVVWLARSAVINHSIGLFTATFVYSLAAVAWINRDASGVIPPISVWFAVLLLLSSLLLFVLLVERVGMLQVTRVLAFAGDEGRKVIERMYGTPFRSRRDPGRHAAPPSEASAAALPVVQTLSHHGAPGVVQAVDTEALIALAAKAGGVVVMTVAVGDTVMDGMPILRVHGTGQAPPLDRLLDTVELGPERTFEQDPKYAIRILVDVAIKALSPAINDPTTAVQALDQIEDLLLRLGRCDLDVGRMRDAAGHLRLDMPVPSWDDLVGLALDEIRFCGATSVQVMRRVRALLQDLRAQVLPERLAALEYFLLRVDKGIRRDFADADDQRDALELDRQGLGMAREQPGPANPRT
ncbi:MAG: DUF2254 domain-containing protein [Vicinamibacterales bacterium]|jgi:uncharacterized membrane protein|nr:DUF2254 domain-containing protein [Vicinamibacterales bacterium]